MFELGEEQVTLEFLQKKAKEYNMDFNSYLEKMKTKGLKEIEPGKTLTPQKEVKGAAVEKAKAPSMDFKLESGSLDYNDPKIRKQLGFTYGEEQRYLRNQTLPSDINERISSLKIDKLQQTINQTFGERGQGQLTTAMPSYEDQYKKYIETKKENKEARQKMISITGLDPYEPKIDNETALKLSNNLISNIKLTEENLKSSYEQSFQKIIASDEYINKHLMLDIFESQNQKIEDYKNKLTQEYDLTDSAQVDAANQKLESFISESINNAINSNKTYKNRIKTYQEALDEAFQNKYKEFKREELGIDDDSSFFEGVQKGYKQFQVAIDKTMLASRNEQILDLENKIAGKNNDEIVSVGGTFMPREGTVVGAEKKTVKQVKQDLYIKKNEILKNLDEIGKQEFDLQFFKEAEGYSLSDISLMAGEQVIQVPVAALTFGVGVFAQEYGNAYFDTIYAKLEAEGKKLTDENFLAALEAGYGDPSIAATSAGIQSALEFGGASTIAKAIIGKPAQGFVRSIIKDGIRRYVKEGGLRAGAKAISGAGLTEFLTESFQTLTSQIAKGTAGGELSKYINVEEIKKSAIQGGIIGTLFPLVGRVGKQTIRETSNAVTKIASIKDPESTTRILDEAKKQVEQNVKDGIISTREGEETLKAISDVDNANQKIPKNIKGKDRVQAIELLVEKQKLQNKANFDEAFVDLIKPRLEEIQIEISKIAIKSELINNTQQSKALLDRLKIQTNQIEANTSEEFLKLAKQYGITDAEVDDAGRISSDGKTILINLEAAANTAEVTVGSHEVLHRILLQTINKAGDQIVPLANLFKEEIKKLNPEIFEEGSYVRDRLSIYQNDPNKLDETSAEELFTIYSDAILSGRIKYNETIFTKLGDAIRRLLQTLGFKQIRFNSGKDVYNFIKDYNNSIKTGKASKALKDAVDNGIAISPEIKATESIISKQVETNSKASKGIEQSNKVQEIFDNQGVAGAMDIIDAFTPILNKITNNYKGTPNFNFQELKDAIAYDPDRGLLGLIMKYKPESNVPLAAYINKYLPSRAIEFAQMQLGTQFELDVTEAKGIAAEEAIEEQIEIKEKTEITFAEQLGITEEIKQKIEQAVIKTFGTRLPNTNSKDFKNALIKAYRIELKPTIAKLMGTKEKYESFLADNFTSIYNILPQTTINKRFSIFADPVLDENGKQLRERTAEGNKIFTKKKITKAEWLNYFIGRNVGISTKGVRKTSIAEEIGVELAFDAATETIKNPVIMGKFKDIQELTGVGLAENFIEEIARQIDRNNRSKASKGLTATELSNLSFALANILKEEKGKTDSLRFINYAPDGFTNDQIEFVKEFVIKLWESGFINGSNFGGLVFEQSFIETLNDFGVPVLKKGQEVKKGAGYDSTSPDVQIQMINGILYLEAKKNEESKLGQVTANIYVDENRIEYKSGSKTVSKTELPNSELMEAFLIKLMPEIKQLLDFINKKENTNFNKFPLGKAIKESTLDELKQTETYKKVFGKPLEVSANNVEFHYNSKNNYYIHIGGKGTYYIGQNPLNIKNANKFNFPLTLDFTLKRAGRNKNTVSGQRMIKEGLVNFSFSGELKLKNKNIKPSGFNLENESDAKAFTEIISSKASKGIAKKLRVFDFDDTLAKSKSNVLYTMPNGKTGKLNAEQFAKQSDDLLEQGAIFDFSEFSQVIGGEKGPMFDVAKRIFDSGNDHSLYILTARPANAKYAIKTFLDGLGLPFRLDNIVGLGNGSPQAKADWILNKLNFGYNDIYFVDDAYKNVKAVNDALSQKGIKYRSQEVKSKASKGLDREFNELLQQTTGVEWYKEYSPVKAELLGRKKGKGKFFIPYSADDFVGLLYATLGKGKIGDAQIEWYKENLLQPFSRGIQQYEAAKQNALREWTYLKNQIKKDVPAGLNKQNETGFRNQDSVRVYIWNAQGMPIEGMSKLDINENLKYIRNNPALKAFADKLMALNPEGYPGPSKGWLAGDITTDLVSYINDVKRKEFLQEWKDNIDIIFSDKNKNKLKALYGKNYIQALDDILYRMWNGRNRKVGITELERNFQDWINNSVGTVMFFNSRSALLQTISAVNFINFTDNNPINAAAAFANFPQYVKDFAELFNSDFLKQRRSGLQIDINADEIANAASTSENKAKAILSAILKFGFTPTQIADSFAIASGGATFYRNRINKYIKEGLTKEEARKKAFQDFQEIAEESQQSARPDRISMQQASSLGRLILAWGNTPMQYARLTKKATLDLFNNRGDWKTNISKIMYYSVIQNIIFSALQQGLFALLFSDEEDDKEKQRYFKVANSVIDTFLRGTGVYGAVASTAKNIITEIIDQSKKSRPDYVQAAIKLTTLSPPINSKLNKLISAGKTFTYKQSKEKVFTEGFSLENPAFLATGQILSALTNLPADRIVSKADHIYTAMQSETELWQSVALLLGWSEWDLGMIDNKLSEEEVQKKIKKIQRLLKKI